MNRVHTERDVPGAGFPSAPHDHARCVETALADAVAVCRAHGVRLTALRRRVLEIVWGSHRPLGAYAILEVMRAEGRASAPPTVYRALGFLLDQGLVHRVASLNAFVGCASPGHQGSCQFLICESCGTALELNDARLESGIDRASADRGFKAHRHTVEITGLCPRCA